MKNKDEILAKLKELKPKYQNDGLIILGLFGSFANDTATKFSDIDIAYHIEHNLFSKKYTDGFSKLLKIEEIKEELQNIFQTKVDFVPDINKTVIEDLIYV